MVRRWAPQNYSSSSNVSLRHPICPTLPSRPRLPSVRPVRPWGPVLPAMRAAAGGGLRARGADPCPCPVSTSLLPVRWGRSSQVRVRKQACCYYHPALGTALPQVCPSWPAIP